MGEWKIILASASPRRREILEQVGLMHQVIPSNELEIVEDGISEEDMVKTLANQKVQAVSKKIIGDFLIIGADTVVFCDKILGKPQDEKDAYEMLKLLGNKWHKVVTGVAIYDTRTKVTESFCEVTRVKMRNYSDDEIYSYIKTGEPMDKAGSYGIQKLGACLVEKIDGCYFNVVGLPISKLVTTLKKFDVTVM